MSTENTLFGNLSSGSMSTQLSSKQLLNATSVRISEKMDYNRAINKPSINDITLIGNKTSSELYLQDHMDRITNSDIENLLNIFVG